MKHSLFAILFFIIACSSASTIHLGEQDAGRSTVAHLNDIIAISLNGNATTGYGWNFSSSDASAFHIVADSYKPNVHPKGMVGGGGHHIYEIMPLKTGVFHITARYYRSWESFDPQKNKELKFIIEVK